MIVKARYFLGVLIYKFTIMTAVQYFLVESLNKIYLNKGFDFLLIDIENNTRIFKRGKYNIVEMFWENTNSYVFTIELDRNVKREFNFEININLLENIENQIFSYFIDNKVNF